MKLRQGAVTPVEATGSRVGKSDHKKEHLEARGAKMYTQGGKTKGKSGMYNQRRPNFAPRDRAAAAHQPWAAVGSWFLGPRAENGDLFKKMATKAVQDQIAFRESYYPTDGVYVTDELKASQTYENTVKKMEKELVALTRELQHSVPFFSSRYKGHVNWDTLMPANLGYMTAMLYNPNNCAAEASPVTTQYELEVGQGLCKMLGYEDRSTGHLVTGGSLANIEGVWAARNLKYYALGLQDAVANEPRLQAAQDYPVYIPALQRKLPLSKATQWQLLNLNIDPDVVEMPDAVLDWVNKKGSGKELTSTDLKDILKGYAYETLGTQEFCRRHNLKKPACFLTPSTCHVSFVKAATILGLGKENIDLVPVDDRARMNTDELRKILDKKLSHETPVICVVAVMGTTEESSIDPLTTIVQIREDMRKKGLNFAIHADGAWGGYFASMLREPPKDHPMGSPAEHGFVPEMMLSEYVHKELAAFHECDTITIDPHKSGFCPYPAGAICYKDERMNNFLNITGSVLYYHGDVNLGDVGIEGSKPGAAAAGVMLAHRVVGLHKNGYGRILAECNFTAKILYCAWAALPQPGDPFEIAPLQPLPPNISLDDIRRIMQDRILDKSNEELVQDDIAMKFLQEVGPDTLVPCFSVNLRGNTDVDVCNAINTAIFKDLCHATADVTAHRTPLIVTTSTLEHLKHNNALKKLKKNLGLDPSDKTGVKYIITTCMDPWSTSTDFIDELAAVMRNAILCAIGSVKERKAHHDLISGGKASKKGKVTVSYAGNFKTPEHQYFSMAKLQFADGKKASTFNSQAEKLQGKGVPLVFRNTEADKIHDVLLFDTDEDKIDERHQRTDKFDIYQGMPAAGNPPFMTGVEMKVLDVPRFDHFDPLATGYPEFSTYFMYGSAKRAYISHIPTKQPDFQQLIQLEALPEGMNPLALKYGIEVQLPEVKGSPTLDGSGNVVNPLKKSEYKIQYIGYEGLAQESNIKLSSQIWFNGNL